MTRRKRVSLVVQIDVDSDEDRAEALHTVTALIRSSVAGRGNVVSCSIQGGADFIPTDEELAGLQANQGRGATA